MAHAFDGLDLLGALFIAAAVGLAVWHHRWAQKIDRVRRHRRVNLNIDRATGRWQT